MFCLAGIRSVFFASFLLKMKISSLLQKWVPFTKKNKNTYLITCNPEEITKKVYVPEDKILTQIRQ